MQNNYLKIDEHAFDNDLFANDAYGQSVIFCNFFTCQKLLKDTNQSQSYKYKGHTIYINPNLADFEYKICPIICFDKLFERFDNIYKYTEEGEYE